MAEDKILQVMPSVVLALHLLCEQRSSESKWKPYLGMILFYKKGYIFSHFLVKTLVAEIIISVSMCKQ